MPLIDLGQEGKRQQIEVVLAVGREELLSQLTEECGELIQAAQKLRRCIVGVHYGVNMDEAEAWMNEEVADVLLLVDYIQKAGMVDMKIVEEIAVRKNTRWWTRLHNEK